MSGTWDPIPPLSHQGPGQAQPPPLPDFPAYDKLVARASSVTPQQAAAQFETPRVVGVHRHSFHTPFSGSPMSPRASMRFMDSLQLVVMEEQAPNPREQTPVFGMSNDSSAVRVYILQQTGLEMPNTPH